jgi:hypothetical protein
VHELSFPTHEGGAALSHSQSLSCSCVSWCGLRAADGTIPSSSSTRPTRGGGEQAVVHLCGTRPCSSIAVTPSILSRLCVALICVLLSIAVCRLRRTTTTSPSLYTPRRRPHPRSSTQRPPWPPIGSEARSTPSLRTRSSCPTLRCPPSSMTTAGSDKLFFLY